MATLTVVADPTYEDLHAAFSDPDALYEIVDGQILEVAGMSAYASRIALRLERTIAGVAEANGLGFTTIETMFILDPVKNLRRRPDVAFVSAERWPLDRPMPSEGEFEVVPDLVVELMSPSDLIGETAKKRREYFRYNVRQVWSVQPETRSITIYRSTKQIEVFEEGDELTAEDLLPGLRVSLAALFSTTID
jgi:Uma2 family endonuclease